MKTIVVCGVGVMGSGIAQVSAKAGYSVWMYDLSDELAQHSKNNIAAGLEKQLAKGKISQTEKDELLANLVPTSDLSCVADADLVMEAVLENPTIKKALYKKIEESCRPDTIIGTNTSYIPITSLASEMKHPERFLGLHFFNPVYAMKLLEVIRGEKTSNETYQMATAWGESIGKTIVTVNDAPGFVVNRLNKALQIEALRLLHEGVASIEDIDKAAKLGLNHPMGPFELMDGNLELTYTCCNLLAELTGDERYRPTPELEDHIRKGEFGRRTGKGWYNYT